MVQEGESRSDTLGRKNAAVEMRRCYRVGGIYGMAHSAIRAFCARFYGRRFFLWRGKLQWKFETALAIFAAAGVPSSRKAKPCFAKLAKTNIRRGRRQRKLVVIFLGGESLPLRPHFVAVYPFCRKYIACHRVCEMKCLNIFSNEKSFSFHC